MIKTENLISLFVLDVILRFHLGGNLNHEGGTTLLVTKFFNSLMSPTEQINALKQSREAPLAKQIDSSS